MVKVRVGNRELQGIFASGQAVSALRAVEKLTGRKEVVIMHKISITIVILLMLAGVGMVEGTIVEFDEERAIQGADGGKKALVYSHGWGPSVGWTNGHHVILDGDQYGEIWMYGDARATMFGGQAYKLESFGTSAFDMLNGEMELLYAHDNSTVGIYGGSLRGLGATENALIELYAYDVMYHPVGGRFDRGWVEGTYFADDSYFSFDLNDLDSFSHIHVIPEPATVLLFGLGSLLLRRRK